MPESKTLQKNLPHSTDELPDDFNDWLDVDANLAPVALSEIRIQQLDTTPVCLKDSDGSTHYHAKTAQDVADILNLSRQRKQAISLHYKPQTAAGPEYRSLDTSQLKTVREIHFKDTAITVETGITWGELQRHLGQYGRWIPLSYPPKMTLPEILANDFPSLDTGTLNYPGGYPRDYVMGIELATTDGRLNRYGGLVVKNATGYDLNKLYIGSQHEFGVITCVTLKVFPRPVARHTFRVPMPMPEYIWPLLAEIEKSGLPTQWLELAICLTDPRQSALIIQFISHYQDLANQHQQLFKQLIQKTGLPIEPVEAETIHSLLPSHHSYTRINMAYSKLYDRRQNVLKNEPYWLSTIQHCMRGCLPDWVTFSPMAKLGTLVWENPVSLSVNAERNADALLALHDALHGQNPYGIPEGFLEIKGFENTSPYLHESLKAFYDPTSVLT